MSLTAALIVGGSSDIAYATAVELARAGVDVVLTGRDVSSLERSRSDLSLRFKVRVELLTYDADQSDPAALLSAAEAVLGKPIDCVLVAQGAMADQAAAEVDAKLVHQMASVNYVTAATLLLSIAESWKTQRRAGVLAAITSVAGDRGRASNFIYGSTKAALSTFLAGLRLRLAATGITVLDVRPGIVDTAMTWGLPVPTAAAPEQVGRDIAKALLKRRGGVVYTPIKWRLIMAIVRAIPFAVMKRTKL